MNTKRMQSSFIDNDKLEAIYLLLRSNLSRGTSAEVGLYNGYIGPLLFFYHYGYLIRDEKIVSYANVLTKEIVDRMSSIEKGDFQSGIIGVGWGLNHLHKMRFIEAPNSFLNYWDQLCTRFWGTNNFSLENGTLGYATFLLTRITIGKLTTGTLDEKLQEHNKLFNLIRYVEETERLLLQYYKTWEITNMAGIVNFFTIDFAFLFNFVSNLCNYLTFLNSLMEYKVYPEVVGRNAERVSEDIFHALNVLLDHAYKMYDVNDIQVGQYVTAISNMMYVIIFSANKRILKTKISEEGFLLGLGRIFEDLHHRRPFYKFDISSHNNRFLQILFKTAQVTKSESILKIFKEVKDKMFKSVQKDRGCELGLIDGLSGYGLSILSAAKPKYGCWDQAIGLS